MWKSSKTKILYVSALSAIILGVAVLFMLHSKDDKTSITTVKRVAYVTITKDGFDPATLIVKKGTTIIWTNADDSEHQLYANPYPSGKSLPGLKSKVLSISQTYSYTVDKTGIYGYHDQLNPATNATFEVKD